MATNEMQNTATNVKNVIKRNGTIEKVNFEKIRKRLYTLSLYPYELKNVDLLKLTNHIIEGLHDQIETSAIDLYSAKTSQSMFIHSPEYTVLASRICVSNLHKETLSSFFDKCTLFYNNLDQYGNPYPLINQPYYEYVKEHKNELEAMIDYSRDYNFDFFGFKTLEELYFFKLNVNGKVAERPQDLFMRLSISLHHTIDYDNDPLKNHQKRMKYIKSTYEGISNNKFTHATPTLNNSGTIYQSLLSCFLLSVDDNIKSVHDAFTNANCISSRGGGCGIDLTRIRSAGELVRGNRGKSCGINELSKVFQTGAKCFHQGNRKGSYALYLEMHHPDVLDFLELRTNTGALDKKAFTINPALWICDLFMQRVANDEIWSLFDPHACPKLNETYGDEYNEWYLKYESEKKYKKQIKARDIWKRIFKSQKETGYPYMCYKDTVNRYNNQKNIGMIRSSNLCTEIVEYSSSDEYACCTLASICLPKFIDNDQYNYTELMQIVDLAVRNLNNIIDINHYPVIETEKSNKRHRPIGLGVQGLADVFAHFNLSYESPKAKLLNKYIFETLYYAALSASVNQSREIYMRCKSKLESDGFLSYDGKTYHRDTDTIPKTIGAYSTFEGSPMSQGIFHFEMYGMKPEDLETKYDWETLREKMKIFGARNSLLIALMPTASTSQIMGNTECIEPFMANVFKRETTAGEFPVMNKYLVKSLMEHGLWNKEIQNCILNENGSIQNIYGIPQEIKNIFKTVWEIKQSVIIDLAADRQPFVDQAQSLNLFKANLQLKQFTEMQFTVWKKQIKTTYYLRTKNATNAQKIAVDETYLQKNLERAFNEPDDICLSCSG